MNLEAQLQELALAEPSLEDQRLALADAEPSLDHYVREAPCEQLPQEVEEGNVEYKLKLVAVSDGEFFASEPGGQAFYCALLLSAERFQHLVTQMHWRLREGSGLAVYHVNPTSLRAFAMSAIDTVAYQIGVEDNGHPQGLGDDELETSLATLRRYIGALCTRHRKPTEPCCCFQHGPSVVR